MLNIVDIAISHSIVTILNAGSLDKIYCTSWSGGNTGKIQFFCCKNAFYQRFFFFLKETLCTFMLCLFSAAAMKTLHACHRSDSWGQLSVITCCRVIDKGCTAVISRYKGCCVVEWLSALLPSCGPRFCPPGHILETVSSFTLLPSSSSSSL